MTAPVPPDANGLREAVLREAADLLHVHRFDHRKDAGDVGGPDSFYRGVQWCRDYLRTLAAAASTSQEDRS